MKEMVKGRISVVVAVWNVEPFLRKCVKSLLNQTYPDIEIILVNDGSDDNSGKICDAFAKDESNVKVIHQKNQGVCAARNTGLAEVTGEFIGFVDPDDWATDDMYQYLYDNLIKYEADISCCRYYRVSRGEDTYVRTDGITYVYDTEEAINELVNNFTIRSIFWNKLFKRELFEDVQFPVGTIYEGTFLVHKIFEKANKIVFLPDAKYYYYDYENSYVNTIKLTYQCDFVLAHIERYNDLHEKYPKLNEKLLTNVVRQSIELIKLMASQKNEIPGCQDKLDKIGAFINSHNKELKAISTTNDVTMKKLNYLVSLSTDDRIKAITLDKASTVYRGVRTYRNQLRKNYKAKRIKKKNPITVEHFSQEDKRIFKKLHDYELELVDEFVRICDKHGLNYFLYGGTLLGAKRHGGFIPWDDDIDIVMLREDYDKFAQVVKDDLGAKYFYQTCFTDPDFPMLFAKIRMNNTEVREEKWDHLSLHKGIYIDILPLDDFPKDTKKGKKLLNKFNILNFACNQDELHSFRPDKQAIFKVYKLYPKTTLYKMRDDLIRSYSGVDTDKVCSFGSHYRPLIKRVLKKEWFSDFKYMEFEGRKLKVPIGWEGYLIHLFGQNYMDLPPESKRVNHFNFYDIKFDDEENE